MTPSKPRCLVVDDEQSLSELLVITLQKMGLQADSSDNLDDARFMLRQHRYDLCLTDMRLPDGNGLDLVRHISQHYSGLPVAVITAYGSAENAVSALKAGAFDYITKPISLQQLRPLVQSALKLTEQRPISSPSVNQLIGNSEPIQGLLRQVEQAARSQAPVLITGETGTGKTLLAHLVHQASVRRDAPFVQVDCAALQPAQIEATLFGQVKGAYPGAHQDKLGLFQTASGGVLLLDEVARLPLNIQLSLLQVIQDKSLRRLGSDQPEGVDVRIISTSRMPLGDLMLNGQFRQDLYYRLNVIHIHTPALRDIPDDIGLISEYLLQHIARAEGSPVKKLSEAAENLLALHPFHGNVRELESALQRACALADQDLIEPEHLGMEQISYTPTIGLDQLDASGLPLPDLLEQIEKQAIMQALEKTRQNKTAAAKLLGVSFRTLRYRLSKLGLGKSDEDEDV